MRNLQDVQNRLRFVNSLLHFVENRGFVPESHCRFDKAFFYAKSQSYSHKRRLYSEGIKSKIQHLLLNTILP